MINNIESDATKLWEELGGYIPANPVKLANSFRIDVCSAELKDGLVGGIVKDNETDKVKIYLPKNEPIYNQRFIIAHQMGHYFYHMIDKKKGFCDTSNYLSNNKSIEKEANLFAAAFLMNKKYFIECWSKYKSIPILSKIFGVSWGKIKYRLGLLCIQN